MKDAWWRHGPSPWPSALFLPWRLGCVESIGSQPDKDQLLGGIASVPLCETSYQMLDEMERSMGWISRSDLRFSSSASVVRRMIDVDPLGGSRESTTNMFHAQYQLL